MAASGVCEPSDECVQLIRGHDTGNKPSLDGDSVKQSEQPVELSKRKLKRLKKTEKWEENKLRKRYCSLNWRLMILDLNFFLSTGSCSATLVRHLPMFVTCIKIEKDKHC